MPIQPTFSQREGYTDLPEPLRLEYVSEALRIELWGHIARFLQQFINRDIYGDMRFSEDMQRCIQATCSRMFKMPHDSVSRDPQELYNQFRNIVLEEEFRVVFDFIELLLGFTNRLFSLGDMTHGSNSLYSTHLGIDLAFHIQHAMDDHVAAYHFTSDDWPMPPYRFEPHASQRGAELTLGALQSVKEAGLQGVERHLDQAATHLSANRWADTVRESIHSVESVVREITSKESLTDGLKTLESRGVLIHSALKDAFKKLYGYASNEPGIRHALDATQDEASVGKPEAMFMYISCTAFVDYLLQQRDQYSVPT